jgi:hypothetical protein
VKLAPIALTQTQLDCEYSQVCADGTGLEEEFRSGGEMGSLRGHSPTVDAMAANRDYAHVLMSPRVGGASSPFHPMSRRSLSQKRMNEPSANLLLKLFKGQRPNEDDSPRDSNTRLEHDGDSVKVHGKKEHGHVSRDLVAFLLSATRRNWRQTAFFLSTLLVISLMLLKLLFLGLYPIQQQSSDTSKVISFERSFSHQLVVWHLGGSFN